MVQNYFLSKHSLSTDPWVPPCVHRRTPLAPRAPWCSSLAEGLGGAAAGQCPDQVYRCRSHQTCRERRRLGGATKGGKTHKKHGGKNVSVFVFFPTQVAAHLSPRQSGSTHRTPNWLAGPRWPPVAWRRGSPSPGRFGPRRCRPTWTVSRFLWHINYLEFIKICLCITPWNLQKKIQLFLMYFNASFFKHF